MTAGARTFSIEDALLDPPALPPPPLRHALFVSLVALAALIHLTTITWSDLYDHTEGQYAGAAREMIQTHQWLWPTNDGLPRLPKPPLLYWLIIGSFKVFGINSAAARLPIALAMIASVALTFLIGEKLGGYWRGIFAGLIYLCSCGTSLLGRVIMPEPVCSAFIAGAIFCGVCGYQRRRARNFWFLGVWICCVVACLTKSLVGLIYPLVVFLVLGALYREARLRFRRLFHWSYMLIFVVLFVLGTSRPSCIFLDFCSNCCGLNGWGTCALFPTFREAITESHASHSFGCILFGCSRGRSRLFRARSLPGEE